LATQFQLLSGLGATLAYAEPEVVQYTDADELYTSMFAELGLDMLRLRNRYGYAGEDDLATAATIVGAASTSLGRKPTVILTSWSPPASLKSNGATLCQGEQDTCTLVRASTGAFDYDAYASYWRDSLDAYEAVGVVPDFVAIQNNPDYVPTAEAPGEGCRFLPTEGTAAVSVDGSTRSVDFPGYAQAIQAVLSRFQDLELAPKLIAPEASEPGLVGNYVQYLDVSTFDAIGHHLYGSDPESPDLAQMQQLAEIGQSTGLPVFQTEGAADGIGTAILLHHTLVTEGAAAYLQNALIAPNAESGALIVLGDSQFTLQPAYHALRHFARFTDPGWVRTATTSDSSDLLASTWLSPEGAVTVLFVNAGANPLDVALAVDVDATVPTQVTRTAFDGVERSANLGSLPGERIVHLPGHSVITVAFESE
jgi:O-glycosyl hydrolase